mmetsp:Transcript_37892/g.60731  ORF Transcript_37892/g.60731 Transcript_37892/m.60731 type:complete len:374 (+) Transcript_37892:96-1217(+)
MIMKGCAIYAILLSLICLPQSTLSWNSIDDAMCFDEPKIDAFHCPQGGTFKMKEAWSWSKFECDVKITESLYTRMESKCDLGSCTGYTDPDKWYKEAGLKCSVPSYHGFLTKVDRIKDAISSLDIDLLDDATEWIVQATLGTAFYTATLLLYGDLEGVDEETYNDLLLDDDSWSSFFWPVCAIHDVCYRATDRTEFACDAEFFLNLLHFCGYVQTTNQKKYSLPSFSAGSKWGVGGLVGCYNWAAIYSGFVFVESGDDGARAGGLEHYRDHCSASFPVALHEQPVYSEAEKALRLKILGMQASDIMNHELKAYYHARTPEETVLHWQVNALIVVVVLMCVMLCLVQWRVYGQRKKHRYAPVKLDSSLESDTEC